MPELTEDQFQRLKTTAKSVQTASRVATVGDAEAAEELADRSLEGLLPSVSDHRMSNYLFAIRNQLPRPAASLNEETVYRSIEALESASSQAAAAGDEQLYPVQVRVRDLDWTPPLGSTITSKIGPIFSLMATKGTIGDMQHDTSVRSLELGRDIDVQAQECAVSVPYVKADIIHGGSTHERGDQALVGTIDSGIDILHECFLNGNLKSRIDAVWVQRDNTGRTPHQVDPANYRQDYGTLYLAQDIQTFVNNDLVNGNNSTPSQLRDPGPAAAQDYGHGTHVASIAAGRTVGTFGGGMAPEARIVAVIPHMKTQPPDPPSLGYSNSHQGALSFSWHTRRRVDCRWS